MGKSPRHHKHIFESGNTCAAGGKTVCLEPPKRSVTDRQSRAFRGSGTGPLGAWLWHCVNPYRNGRHLRTPTRGLVGTPVGNRAWPSS